MDWSHSVQIIFEDDSIIIHRGQSGKHAVVSSINREARYLFISTLFSVSVSDRLWTAEGYQTDRPPSHSPPTPPTSTVLTHCQASTPFNYSLEQQTRPALSTCQLPYNSYTSRHTDNHVQTHRNTRYRLVWQNENGAKFSSDTDSVSFFTMKRCNFV